MSEVDVKTHIFNKEVSCPVCNAKFDTQVVKVNSPRIESKDSDFFIRYRVVNPYFYDIWMCNGCGYSATKADFPKIRPHQKELVLKD